MLLVDNIDANAESINLFETFRPNDININLYCNSFIHKEQKRNMMNVLYVINESEVGGAALSLLNMLEANKGRLNPVIVLPASGSLEERVNQMHIGYYIIPFETDNKTIGEHTAAEKNRVFMSNYQAALALQEVIKKMKIQIIHTNSSVSNVGEIAALMAGIPHIWHIRELLEEDFNCEFIDKQLKGDLFHCADAIISISQCVREAYQQKYGIDSVCIYNGVSVARFMCKDFSTKHKDWFMIAGLIFPNKGQMDVVKAVNELVKKGKDIQLYIVGAANGYQYKWILEKYIEKNNLRSNVHILAFQQDLSSLRAKCQFSITASKMEALGRVTIESMLAGCVVIGANTGGTVEIIGNDGTRGYLYEQGDYNNLARIMQYAMEHEVKNKQIQKEAQSYAVERFNETNYIEKIIKVYETVIGKNKDIGMDVKVSVLQKLEDEYAAAKSMLNNQQPENKEKEIKLRRISELWLNDSQGNHPIEEELAHRGIKTIAIYGMGYLGCHLYDELENSRVCIKYVMDKALTDGNGILNVENLDGILPEVDAIIVTVLGKTKEIIESIRKKSKCTIFTLEEVVGWRKGTE